MRKTQIPKGGGRFRTIYVPTEDEKVRLRECAAYLQIVSDELSEEHGVSHGFVTNRSPVTNALQHIGFAYTLSFDLADFFDTVRPAHIPASILKGNGEYQKLMEENHHLMFTEDAAHQGPPTSPALANIAAIQLDRRIIDQLQRTSGRFRNFVYTRYADDLTFSYDSPDVTKMLLREVPRIVDDCGFRINPRKTHLQQAKAGRRMITGIAVDDRLHIPRSVRRRLRAAKHQIQNGIRPRNLRRLIGRQRELNRKGRHVSLCHLLVGGARGLAEWAKMRLPKGWAGQESKIVPHVAHIPQEVSSKTVMQLTYGGRRFE